MLKYFIFFIFIENAFACMCDNSGPFQRAAWKFDLVILGTVDDYSDNSMYVNIKEVWKGTEHRKRILVEGDNGLLCRENVKEFPLGSTWVFALSYIRYLNFLELYENGYPIEIYWNALMNLIVPNIEISGCAETALQVQAGKVAGRITRPNWNGHIEEMSLELLREIVMNIVINKFPNYPNENSTLLELDKFLENKDEDVRVAAVDMISKLQDDTGIASPYLLKALSDESIDVKITAMNGLNPIGSLSEVVIPILVEFLKHQENVIRLAAISALGDAGHEAQSAESNLIEMLNDKDEYIRDNAISALIEINPKSRNVKNALIKMLNDENENVRINAIFALNRIVPKSEDVEIIIIKLLTDLNKDIASSAAFVLYNTSSSEICFKSNEIELLTSALNNKEEPIVRMAAAKYLGFALISEEKLDYATIISSLNVALKDPSPEVRAATKNALEMFKLKKSKRLSGN